MQNCSPCKSGTKYTKTTLESCLSLINCNILSLRSGSFFIILFLVNSSTTLDPEVPVVSRKTNMSEPGQWLASTLVTSTPSSNRLSPGSRQVTSLACINKAYKTNYRVEPVILCVSFPPNLYISLRAFFPHILKLLNPEH